MKSKLTLPLLFAICTYIPAFSQTCTDRTDEVCPNPVVGKVLERKDVDNLTAAELQSFRNGVKAMMDLSAKDAKDPRGWNYQAYIHGLPKFVEESLDLYECCQHSTWYFLSWHRMQVYYFERILRAQAKDPNLTVPYWNFTTDPGPKKDVPEKRKMPASFRTATYIDDTKKEVPNPLYTTHRRAGINDTKDAKAKPICIKETEWETAYGKAKFSVDGEDGSISFGGSSKLGIHHGINETETGAVENQPHNAIHLVVGIPGDDRSLASADGAGLDPAFWPFHANLDRVFDCWQQSHNFLDPTKNEDLKKLLDSKWGTTKFFFFDVDDTNAKGWKKVCLTGKQLIKTASQLGYKYTNCYPFPLNKTPGAKDDSTLAQAQSAAAVPRTVVSTALRFPPELRDEPVTITMDLPSDVQQRIRGLLTNELPDGSIVLHLDDIHMNQPVTTLYEVYLDLPDKPVLDWRGRYYVGLLNFFGVGSHHHNHVDGDLPVSTSGGRSFDITNVVRRLAANNEWRAEKLSVTFAVTQDEPDEDCVKPAPPGPDAHIGFTEMRLSVITGNTILK
jgi:tyrosinase